MKFTLPTLIALMGAMPVFAGEELPLPPTLASEIASPVEAIIVTPWDQGRLDGTEVSEIHDIVLVDGEEYKKVTAYGPSDQPAPLSPSFPVHRDVWTDHYYGCQVHVVKDPGVPIVHIKFEGEGQDLKSFANKHEDEVLVDCEWLPL